MSEHGTPAEVLLAFARLGVTSFGGPVAHLGYFRAEFVERRRWLDERTYAELVALAQFLPGPASSKVGFSLGLLRAGWRGAACAWLAFTLPSALLLYAFARGAAALGGTPLGAGLLHGLKLTAVAIVAHAVWSMARSLCPDLPRRALAIVAGLLAVALGPGAGQLAAIGVGALLGAAGLRRAAAGGMRPAPAALAAEAGAAAEGSPPDALPRDAVRTVGMRVGTLAGTCAAAAFAALLAAAWVWPGEGPGAMWAAFYRAGALVFGGGHVVLPLLDAAVVVPGWTDATEFLAGYGAAQAVPGPLFTFAAFLGAQPGMPVSGAAGAALALVAIFVPGLLLQVAALSSWQALRERPLARAAMAGVNAAVVGLLAAALWDPVWTGAVRGVPDALVALIGFVALVSGRVPVLAVVAGTAVAGAGLALLG